MFRHISGKFYLVDMEYLNTEGFLAPYPGIRYYPHEYRGVNHLPRNVEELFNHRHSSLRVAIQKSFEALRTRFPILKLAAQYSFQVQRDIVIAACVLHNYIRREERNDWLFSRAQETTPEVLPELDDQREMQLGSTMQEQVASSLRESIAVAMWNDFINKWDEW